MPLVDYPTMRVRHGTLWLTVMKNEVKTKRTWQLVANPKKDYMAIHEFPERGLF